MKRINSHYFVRIKIWRIEINVTITQIYSIGQKQKSRREERKAKNGKQKERIKTNNNVILIKKEEAINTN